MPLISTKLNLSTLQLFNPFLIYFILCFSPLIEGGTTYYPVAVIQFLSLILLASGTFSFYQGCPKLSLKSPPFYAILVFLVYVVIIAFLTPYKLMAFQQIQLFLFYFIFFYFSILFRLTHDNFQKYVINIFLTMAVFEAIYGIAQYFIFHQRAKGTFFNPDFYGEYLAIIFCVVLGRFIDVLEKKKRWLDGTILILTGSGIVFSQSRGAALAWSIGISFVLWKRFRFKLIYAWLILFLLFIVIPNPLQNRILNDYKEDPYSFSRIEMWKETIQIIKDHPAGIGLEMFPLISPQYVFPMKGAIQKFKKIAESPHNDYLRLFAETGIAGGIFFIWIISLFYLKWTGSKDKSFLHYGMLGAALVFLVHALVDSNFHEPALVITTITLSTFLLDKKLFSLTRVVKREKLKVKSELIYPLTPLPFYLLLFALGLLVIKPAVGWYFYSKGYDQVKNQKNELALLNFRNAIFWEKGNAAYHNALASVYFNIFTRTNYYGWIFKSLEELNWAIELNPEEGNYYTLKGAIYKTLAMRESKPASIEELNDKAFTNYSEALKLLPYNASIYMELGQIQEHFQKFTEAESLYSQAIRLEPNYLIVREKKIELLLEDGKKEEAAKEYQDLLAIYNQVKERAGNESDGAFIHFNQEKLEKLLKS